MKLFIKITLISIFGLIVLFIICYFLLNQWFYSYLPSPGIWQYKDDNLEITIYVPSENKVLTDSGFEECKAEILYKGKKQNAIFLYHTKMYQLELAINEYIDIGVIPLNYVINGGTYRTPMKRGEWEFKEIRATGILKDYNGKNLIFKKIGKYKEPE